jgi:hypothetical protein
MVCGSRPTGPLLAEILPDQVKGPVARFASPTRCIFSHRVVGLARPCHSSCSQTEAHRGTSALSRRLRAGILRAKSQAGDSEPSPMRDEATKRVPPAAPRIARVATLEVRGLWDDQPTKICGLGGYPPDAEEAKHGLLG